MSVLALSVPDFLVQLELRRRPDLADKPFALLGPDDRVWAASKDARDYGVAEGLAPTHARARCRNLVVRELDEGAATDEQIWQLVRYLRTFGQPAGAQANGQATAVPEMPQANVPNVQEPLPPIIFTRRGNIWRSDGSVAVIGAGEIATNAIRPPSGAKLGYSA